ncbi:MAG: hypothetical protein ACXACU_17075 [Candidatus Hodarchaeales archaeon]
MKVCQYPVTPSEAVHVEVPRGKKIILIDFDGVIHSYSSGWQGVDNIPDEPVKITRRIGGSRDITYTSIDWLTQLASDKGLTICIYSSRSKDVKGLIAMTDWLLKYGMSSDTINQIYFPTKKPAAFLTIDDRAIQFDGTFVDAHVIHNFKTWQRR